MPNHIKYKFRQYCKTCEDFTIHDRVYIDEQKHDKFNSIKFIGDNTFESICDTCSTQYTHIDPSDIEESKIQLQRNRFKSKRKSDFEESLKYLSNPLNDIMDMFKAPGITELKIIEDDAGLEDEELLQRKIKKEQNAIILAEIERFKNVGRNDKCLCGSGKKYKKCCIDKHS